MNLPSRALHSLVRAYQLLLSPLLGPHCRHLPSCSSYALEAIERHGAMRGAWLALRRLSRCHPWGTSGYDPVPPVAGAGERSRARESEPTARTGGEP